MARTFPHFFRVHPVYSERRLMALLSKREANRQLELIAEQLQCPNDPWCERCECAGEDDVCFPDEAVRELRAYAWALEHTDRGRERSPSETPSRGLSER